MRLFSLNCKAVVKWCETVLDSLRITSTVLRINRHYSLGMQIAQFAIPREFFLVSKCRLIYIRNDLKKISKRIRSIKETFRIEFSYLAEFQRKFRALYRSLIDLVFKTWILWWNSTKSENSNALSRRAQCFCHLGCILASQIRSAKLT